MLLFVTYFSFFWNFFLVNNTNAVKLEGYNLILPNQKLILPPVLHEISGLTDIDDNTIGCVQDEKGIIFIYDISGNKINKQYVFNIDGDYEEITRVNSTLYILRSDGTLFEVTNYATKQFKVLSYATGIPSDNNEGMCYDKENNRLLIAAKGKIGKGPEFKDKRVVYAFDFETKKLSKEPVYDFDVEELKAFAKKENVVFPTKTKKKGAAVETVLKFRPSAIAIHPVTNKLYLLSAADHCLFIFNMDGAIEHIEKLDPLLFNKSEGITFFPNGDMIVSNEGQTGQPTVLRFNYKK